MLQKIKNFFKRILPPPVRTFMREIERVLAEIRGQGRKHSREIDSLHSEISVLREEQRELEHQLQTMRDEVSSEWSDVRDAQQQSVIALNELKETYKQAAIALSGIQEMQKQTFVALADLHDTTENGITVCGNVFQQISDMNNSAERYLKCQNDNATHIYKKIEDERSLLSSEIDWVKWQVIDSKRNAAEAVWAEVFNNTISDSGWLRNTTFSPGRWAVGYASLYVMYRVLNEVKPKRILELGLGQSTRMIAQYAVAHEDVEHIIVEQDTTWIEFFQNNFELSGKSKIVQLDYETTSFLGADGVRVYRGFQDSFEDQQFDFIFIDAPQGGDMKQYARIDVLRMIPECLGRDFVIMLDDAERSGEAHMLAEMESALQAAGIPYKRGNYLSKKDCVLLCAEHMGFLTTM